MVYTTCWCLIEDSSEWHDVKSVIFGELTKTPNLTCAHVKALLKSMLQFHLIFLLTEKVDAKCEQSMLDTCKLDFWDLYCLQL